MIIEEFNNAVGEIVAKNAAIKSLTLTIEINEPQWATQLDFIKPQLLKTLTAHFGVRVKDFNIILRRTHD